MIATVALPRSCSAPSGRRPPFTEIEKANLERCLTDFPDEPARQSRLRFGAMDGGAHKERAGTYTDKEFQGPVASAKRRMQGLPAAGSKGVRDGGSAATTKSKADREAKRVAAFSHAIHQKKDDRLGKLVPPPPDQSPPPLQRLPQAAAPPPPAFTPVGGPHFDALLLRHAGLSLLLNPLLFSSPHTFRTPVHPAHKTPRPIQPATRTQATGRQSSSR